MQRWFATFVFCAALGTACSSDDEDIRSTHADGSVSGGSGGSAGVSGGTGGASGTSGAGTGGIQLVDAGYDGPVLVDAGWFDCKGCACNGATSYCLTVSAGLGAPPPPDAAVCQDEPNSTGCETLPSDCPNPPSCDCLNGLFGGGCFCSDDGGGLKLYCALP